VIAPASTGRLNTNKNTVIITLQTNKGIISNFIKDNRILKIVHKKLIPPKIDLTPAKCKLKIAISTEEPL
jgi:hypothetical protein